MKKVQRIAPDLAFVVSQNGTISNQLWEEFERVLEVVEMYEDELE